MSQHKTSLLAIPARFAFLEKVEQKVCVGKPFSLLFVDLIRFSDINRSFGYSVGDEVLATVAYKLKNIFSDKVQLGRVSGDLFGLLFEGKHSVEDIRRFHTKLVEHFNVPVSAENASFAPDFNVGAVRYPLDANHYENLFALAETALQQAKKNKFEKLHIVSGQDVSTSSKAIALQSDLRRAFRENELELFFQPQIELDTGRVSGAECLLRWNHPIDGLVIPGPLIEAAESYNLMHELGYWVIQSAFEKLLELRLAGIRTQLSINMSPTQLYDAKLTSFIKDLSQRMSIDLEDIELELTENVALSNSLLVTQRLRELKELGVKIAIDDFGTGYSNLAYIRDLPIDKIKIDKTFVDAVELSPVDQAIAQSIVTIANALKCDVVAEGIESLGQAQILSHIGVHVGQGYLFARPVNFDTFKAFYLEQKSSADKSVVKQA